MSFEGAGSAPTHLSPSRGLLSSSTSLSLASAFFLNSRPAVPQKWKNAQFSHFWRPQK